MAEIRPFHGMRYSTRAGKLEVVVAPPYDVIGPEQLKELRSRSPYNITYLDLPAGLEGVAGKVDQADPDAPYRRGADAYRSWIAQEVLAADPEPSLYVYRQTYQVPGESIKVLIGILGRVRLHDFSEGVILPHEHTLPKAKADRFRHLRAFKANLSPIFSFYSDPDGEVSNVLAGVTGPNGEKARGAGIERVVDFVDEHGVHQQMWRVWDRSTLERITSSLADRRFYIADGHHRYETAFNYRNEQRNAGTAADRVDVDHVLMMVVALETGGLTLLPIHRMVRGIAPEALKELPERLSRYFEVSPVPADPSALLATLDEQGRMRPSFGLYAGAGKAWSVTLRDAGAMDSITPQGKSDPWKGLDVAILHTLGFGACLDLSQDVEKAESHFRFTREAAEAMQAVDGGEAQLAVLLNPTRLDQVRDVAIAGDKMPQKSTYFYPKLLTGLVMNDLTID